jgi:hypothetical protein
LNEIFLHHLHHFLGKARKYSTVPSAPAEFLIPKSMPNSAKQLQNASITTSSWKKHLAARKSFESFETFQGKRSDWPLSDTHICEYISWAILKKGLRASTV